MKNKNSEIVLVAALAAVFFSSGANFAHATPAIELNHAALDADYFTLKGAPRVTVTEETLEPEEAEALLRQDTSVDSFVDVDPASGPIPRGERGTPRFPSRSTRDDDDEDSRPSSGRGQGTVKDVSEVVALLDQIVNLGKKVWAIVEANKPVVTVTSNSANALPKGITAWEQLGSWRKPVAKTFRYVYENKWGIDVVDFSYRVVYTHGGTLDGKGLYLTNVSVVPSKLSVLWGYKFNAVASVPSVVNAGSIAAPVAAAEILVDWSVGTDLKIVRQSNSYWVRGDGVFETIATGDGLVASSL